MKAKVILKGREGFWFWILTSVENEHPHPLVEFTPFQARSNISHSTRELADSAARRVAKQLNLEVEE